MAKSLGRLPSASTSRLQPIGPAPVSSRRPARSKPLISVWTKRTRLASTVLERDAYRVGGAGAAGDPGQLGDHLVVVVPVDQGQLQCLGWSRSLAVRRKATCSPA